MEDIEERWMKYYSYLASKEKEKVYCEDSVVNQIIDFLKRERVISSNTNILDVGAGTGDFSLAFAKNCRNIHDIDINQDCINVINKRTELLHYSNIMTEQVKWQSFAPERRYNLVFASMCPAINSKEEILHMERLSSEYCCIVTAMTGSKDEHRSALMKKMPIKIPDGLVKNADEVFHMLFILGRQPFVRCFSKEYETQLSIEEAKEQFQIYFEIFGIRKEDSEPIVDEYLREKSTEGELREKLKMNYALLYWHI